MKKFLLGSLVTATFGLLIGAASSIRISQIKPGVNPGTFVLTSINGVNSWAVPTSAINFSDAEVPSGTINGTNPAFILAHTPAANCSPLVIVNIPQVPGVDYTISGTTITFAAASIPQTGDTIEVWYRY